MKLPSNLLEGIPANLSQELIAPLLTSGALRIERIVSRGHCSPDGFWYDQQTSEWVLLLSGKARLRFDDDEVVEMNPGSYVNIAAHRRHRVEWTHPEQTTVWLAIHYASDSQTRDAAHRR
jgi:cupin 2 domain-containing protein